MIGSCCLFYPAPRAALAVKCIKGIESIERFLMASFCPSCGAPVEGRFCAKCGNSVAGGSVPPQPSISAAPMAENVASALCYVLGLVTGIVFLVIPPYSQNRAVGFHAFQSI